MNDNIVLYEVNSHIASITLNQPDMGNPLNADSYRALIDAFEKANEDDTVRSVILTGAGRHFCSGGNIREFLSMIENDNINTPEQLKITIDLVAAIRNCSKPVVAMINHAAFGAGCAIALACDFRIVAPSSQMCLAFINMALSGDTAGLYLAAKIVGMAKANEMMMLGSVIGGEEAVRIGLATKCVADELLVDEAHKLAAKLAAGPSLAYMRQKQLINEHVLDMEAFERYGDDEAAYMSETMHSADFEEAVRAFLGKRRPQFKGR